MKKSRILRKLLMGLQSISSSSGLRLATTGSAFEPDGTNRFGCPPSPIVQT